MKAIYTTIIGLTLSSQMVFSQVNSEIKAQLNFSKDENKISSTNLKKIKSLVGELAAKKECQLSVVILEGNGDKNKKGDTYLKLGIKRAEAVKSVLSQKGINSGSIYTEGTYANNKSKAVPGAVVLTALYNCSEELANVCAPFLEPGVNKVILEASQTDRIINLAKSPSRAANVKEVSEILISYDACTEAAAQNAGRTLGDASELILKHIAAMPAGEVDGYSSKQKNEFVNYLVNYLLFSSAN